MAIEPQARRNLMILARAWCGATGNKLMTCASKNKLDPRFFNDLAGRTAVGPRKEGDKRGSFTFRIYDRTVAWFHDLGNWPDGTKAEDIPEIEDLGHHKRKR